MTVRSLMYVSQADLARRWGVTRQRVHALTKRPGFPKACMVVNGAPAYKIKECDKWHRENVDLSRRRAS
jgi:hypothetical protein